jgi:hypothetical protein
VCVVVPSSFIAIHIRENPKLSPIDETAQFDYVSRVAHGSVPRLGQYLMPSTLELLSCTGTAFAFSGNPPCQGPKTPTAYIGGGFQYEAQQPPTYYAATVPFRWMGVHLLGMSSLTSARATGAMWVSTGLLTLWMAGRIGVCTRCHLSGFHCVQRRSINFRGINCGAHGSSRLASSGTVDHTDTGVHRICGHFIQIE